MYDLELLQVFLKSSLALQGAMKIKQVRPEEHSVSKVARWECWGEGGEGRGGELFPPHLYCWRSDLSRLDAQLHCGQAASGVGDGKWGREG